MLPQTKRLINMKTIIRTGSIEIDAQKVDGIQWVSAKIQKLLINDEGRVLSESGREFRLHRRIDQVALEMTTVVDPVTGKEVTVSVAGVGTLIKAAMTRWMLEDHGAKYDPVLDVVVLDDSSS